MSLAKIADTSVEGGNSDQRWEEHLIHDDSNNALAFAPHGGEMEPATAEQAFCVATALSSCSGWTYCGYADRSAREAYYTTSTEIERDDHEFLPRLDTHEFDTAVAFHGYNPDQSHPDVYVGGGMAHSGRTQVAEAIARQADIDVLVARPGDNLRRQYGGVSPDNIVNWLANEGLQLEQTRQARDEHRDAICRGVVAGLDQLATAEETGTQ